MSPPERQVVELLKGLGDADIAAHSQRFFKTGNGEYGEGDRFLGVRVPVIRKQVKAHGHMTCLEAISLLKSPYHEVRLFAVLLLVQCFSRGDEPTRKLVYSNYLEHARFVNNWDLVDASAHKIVGPFLASRSRKSLYKLARSENLWERRIAMMATYHFIHQDDFEDTLKLARILLRDEEDLIHKSVGWMLREVGKRDGAAERAFLLDHYQSMPRTMLRYAIEKFPTVERQAYLKGTL